jgi:hypothetical protein
MCHFLSKYNHSLLTNKAKKTTLNKPMDLKSIGLVDRLKVCTVKKIHKKVNRKFTNYTTKSEK